MTGEAIIIDPGLDADDSPDVVQKRSPGPSHLLGRLQTHNLRLKQIIITHAHIDHIGGALALKQATGAPILLHQGDLALLAAMDEQSTWLGIAPPPIAPPDLSAEDGLAVGLATLPGQIIYTPGHTQGSVCVYFPSAEQGAGLLFAGDTLFAGTIGRTDLPGGNSEQILRSIEGRLVPLPESTHVIPGHGRETTLGRERERNPFLRGMRG
jgi:hydroxyacylglutathione hydrolase